MTTALPPDPFDVRRVQGAGGLLGAFNEAGVLAAADVHVAVRLTRFAGVSDESVALAVALAVRAPRLGHVHVDLATIKGTAAVDTDEPVDLASLPWPSVEAWLAAVAASGLAAIGESPDSERETDAYGRSGAQSGPRPLRLIGSRLYLDRYWALERSLALDLRRGGEAVPDDVDDDLLAAGLHRLFPGQTDGRQALAAACAVFGRLAVVAGGPGTGKTTTVARIVALLDEQATAAGRPPLQVALAAPTGKAAARLEEAVHSEAADLDVSEDVRARLLELRASTLHRLLGWRGGRGQSYSRFRHDRSQRLPHDLVIVDETSMVSLSLMSRLAEAIRPGARLVLVGDPGQLASIEAGAVLGDIVGPAAEELQLTAATRNRLWDVTGAMVAAAEPAPGAVVADGIVTLERVHRFGTGIAALARAIRAGDADATIDLLSSPPIGVAWIDVDVADPDAREALDPVRLEAVEAASTIVESALNGRARKAIDGLGAFRVLCAHRRGPQGVTSWTARIEGWLEATVPNFAAGEEWYAGRPLLVTENDYELGLFNGDTGVVVRRSKDRVAAVFERRGVLTDFSPARLSAVQTVFAMTIHKSQGSQFDTVAVLLPAPSSPILTRELLYTAVTRAKTKVVIAGTEETVRQAVGRPVARASGLRDRLWGAP